MYLNLKFKLITGKNCFVYGKSDGVVEKLFFMQENFKGYFII